MLQQGPRAPSCSSTASRALGVAFTPHIPPGDSLGRGNTPHLQWGTDHRACLTKLATWEARRLCSSVCKLHLKSSMCVCAYVCECHTLTHVHARTHKRAHSLHQRHPGRLLRGHGHSLCPGPSAPTPGPGPRPGRAMRPCQVDSCPAPGPPRRRPLAALCVNAPRGPPSHHLAWGGLLAACDGSPGEEGLPQTRASCQAAWGECRACRRSGREMWAGLPPPLLTQAPWSPE